MLKKFYVVDCSQYNFKELINTYSFNFDDEPTEEQIEEKINLVRNQVGKFRTDATVNIMYELA